MYSKNIVFIFLLLCFTSCNFAPGSYPYAKRYVINLTEDELINKIEVFKKENPKNSDYEKFGLQDGRRTYDDHWYHIYFTYSAKEVIVKTWIRRKSKTETILAFIALKEYASLTKWKFVNHDFTKKENRKVIKEFENKILENLNINTLIERE